MPGRLNHLTSDSLFGAYESAQPHSESAQPIIPGYTRSHWFDLEIYIQISARSGSGWANSSFRKTWLLRELWRLTDVWIQTDNVASFYLDSKHIEFCAENKQTILRLTAIRKNLNHAEYGCARRRSRHSEHAAVT